jgi:uncharacterized protein (DUF1015 family)
MARIAPFRGFRYCDDLARLMDRLVGPPYDPAGPGDLEEYQSRHDCNIIRLLYGCGDPDQRHLETAQLLGRWLEEGNLVRDGEPAIYLYQIEFQVDELSPRLIRTGFIALLRLQDYEMGMVRPHERTFSGIKEAKLEALSACQANLSQIFTFYDDPELKVAGLLTSAAPGRPDLEFLDPEGITHRLWLVTDPEAHLAAARLMEPKHMYIADGHHRYETCLAHRREMKLAFPTADPRSPFNYTLVYAAALQDPGLSILPAHRLINELPGFDRGEFLDRAGEFFEIREAGLDPGTEEGRAGFRSLLAETAGKTRALGFLTPGAESFVLLALREEVLPRLQIHPALKEVDVAILREVIFRRCLGLTREALSNERLFSYDYDLSSASRKVKAGRARLGFLLNPTRVSQVKVVADAGLTMPRKSTLFYPKVATGLAMSPMIDEELVADPLAPAKNPR